VSLAVLSGIGLSLTGVLLFDVYEDWTVQGNTLASTAVENALPFALLLGLFYTVWELRRGTYSEPFVESVTLWTVAGAVTTVVLVGWVVGIQSLQNELKPWIIVLQTTVVGTSAGLLVGRRTATVERARFESLFESDPAAIADLRLDGDRFVVKATNPEYDTRFGSKRRPRAGPARPRRGDDPDVRGRGRDAGERPPRRSDGNRHDGRQSAHAAVREPVSEQRGARLHAQPDGIR
jgi:hypothetical protein